MGIGAVLADNDIRLEISSYFGSRCLVSFKKRIILCKSVKRDIKGIAISFSAAFFLDLAGSGNKYLPVS